MRFCVLGPVSVFGDDGEAHAITSPSQRTVLAILVDAEARTVTADALIEALWGSSPPRSALASLRTYISRLRRVLGDRLQARDASYILDTAADVVDARRFDDLVRLAGELRPAEAIAVLNEALGLWRGEPFGDLGGAPALAGSTRRLTELRRRAEEHLAGAQLATSDPAAAAASAEALVATEPFREGAWAILVRALVADDRPGEALRTYQRAAETLAEAGLEPSAGLRDAERAALAGEEPTRSRPASAERATRNQVVKPSLGLLGRESDLGATDDHLDTHRVVTLCGPGGVGKTRLAQELATTRADRHRLGCRWVSLADLRDPAAVPLAVAEALGVVVEPGAAADALVRAGTLDVLVVLDNCEHLIDAVAEVVELLIEGGDAARVLATSRQRIGVVGEQSCPVAPLGTSPSGPGVELFLERAQRHVPDLAIDDETRRIVASIVARLDGLPLAIEMAAARLGGLGLADLDAALAERFDILASERRRSDARHQTLDAVIAWSEELLDGRQRAVLADLSVFAGPVTSADITEVIDRPAVTAAVGELAERSLVAVDDRAGTTTYGLLEVVRRRSRGHLVGSDRSTRLRRRHARHFTEVARQADAVLGTQAEPSANQTMAGAFAELRIAHAWALEAEPSVALALSAALFTYAGSRLRDEAHRWAEACEPVLDTSPEASAVLASVAFRANNRGDLDRAQAAGERALDLAGPHPVARFALETLGDTALYRGDLDRARELGVRMVGCAADAGDPYRIAMGTGSVALAQTYGGDPNAALTTLADVDSAGMGPSARGWVAYCEGEAHDDRDPASARKALERAIELADSVDNRFLAGVARLSAVSLLGRVGEPTQALAAFAEIIEHWHQRGDHTHQLTTLRNLVCLLERCQAPAAAAELLGAVTAAGGAPSYGAEAERLYAAASRTRSALGTDHDAHLATGRARTVPAAAIEAMAAIRSLTG